MRGLFIGSYPNFLNPYNAVFFRELIYACADQGIDCDVISTVSIMHGGVKAFQVPFFHEEYTPQGSRIGVYHPKTFSFSAKKIAGFNTMDYTLAAGHYAVMKTLKKIGNEYDFVYGHFILGGGLTASRIGKKYGIPAFIAYGECNFESEVSSKHKLRKEELEGVEGVIAVSSKNRDELRQISLFDNIPIFLSLNSVDKKSFRKMNKVGAREKFSLAQDAFIVGFVGYFKERKGYNRLLQACADLEGVKLAFAGRGENKPTGANVVFCESLPHEDIPEFLNAIDVFVLPTQNEGLSNAIIEAMSCGCCIVSSDLPFNWDVLNSKNSILVDPNNIQEIRDAVIKLRDDAILRSNLSKKAMLDAEGYSIDNRAKNILKFISDVNNGKEKIDAV